MKEKEVSVVVLGGSGHLGKSVFQLLEKSKGINVKGTYYENRPKWTKEDNFFYFNGAASHLDPDAVEIFSKADFVLNFMSPRRFDYVDLVLFNSPLQIAEIVSENGGEFITFGGTINQNTKLDLKDKAIERLSNVIEEKGLGKSVFSAMVVDKDSRLINIISEMSKYKLTPTIGDGSNKVRALHVIDFSKIVCRMVTGTVRMSSGRYTLAGNEKMTIRHIISLTCESRKRTKPIFLNIKKGLALKYKGILDGIFGTNITDIDIENLDYNEVSIGKDICRELKVKPLTLHARVKRDGL